MSGSNRSKLAEAFGVVVLIGLAAAWAAMIWDISAHYARRSTHTVEDARQERQSTATRVKGACVGRQGDPLLECVTEQVESARDQERSAYDLQAQQDMAEWTFWVMLLGVGSITLAAFGIWYVRETLIATREGNAEMVAETRRIGQAQVRAYLSITKIVAEKNDSRICITPTVYNSGQSPGIINSVTYHVMLPTDTKVSRTNEFVEHISAGRRQEISACYIYSTMTEAQKFIVTMELTFTDIFGEEWVLQAGFAGPVKWDAEGYGVKFAPLAHIASLLVSEEEEKEEGEA